MKQVLLGTSPDEDGEELQGSEYAVLGDRRDLVGCFSWKLNSWLPYLAELAKEAKQGAGQHNL